MMRTYDIRTIEAQDFETICLLEKGSSGSRYQAAVFVRQAMTLWPDSFLVAICNGSPVGYLVSAVLPEDPPVAWILRLRVMEFMKRQGIGRALLMQAHDILQEMGADTVFLSCAPVNEGALSFYRRFGYLVSGHETGYFGFGEDRFILSKTFSG